MSRRLAIVALFVGLLFVSGCTEAPPVHGKIIHKYYEDFQEPTLVMLGDDGIEYHFTVTDKQWRSVNKNDRFSTDQLDTPADD